MTAIEIVVDDILLRGLDDWVPIDALLWSARRVSEDCGGDFKVLTVNALEYILSRGLMEIGDLGESGFEAWQEPPARAVNRAVAAVEALNWNPQGTLFWLSNTDKGNLRAESRDDLI